MKSKKREIRRRKHEKFECQIETQQAFCKNSRLLLISQKQLLDSSSSSSVEMHAYTFDVLIEKSTYM